MTDPLDIINEFTQYSPPGSPCPINLMPENEAWLRKLCALADRCATAENRAGELTEALREIVDEARTQNPFSDSEGMCLIFGAMKLLGENIEE